MSNVLDEVVADGEPFGAVVAGDWKLTHHAQTWPLDRGELLVLERQQAGGGVIEAPQASLELGHAVLGPPGRELVAWAATRGARD